MGCPRSETGARTLAVLAPSRYPGSRTSHQPLRGTRCITSSTVHVLGVRHHGPGSARSVRRALETIEPSIVLVEGPPDADAMLPLLIHAGMVPPVALLIYRPEKPRDSVYYPFAAFSPEWQALQYALERGIPARFMDLPVAHQIGED